MPTAQITLKNKIKNSFLFVGRLEKDTGLAIFLDFLDILSKKKIIFSAKFCGDGPMKKNCLPYGEVLGFVDVRKFLATSEFCFAGGYLSILEAMAYQNVVLSGFDNALKKDYLLNSPFAQNIICADQAQLLFEKYQNLKNQKQMIQANYKLAKTYSFTQLADLYLKVSQEK
jgi:glycosyltransferase involved in cell wall biosynthesis